MGLLKKLRHAFDRIICIAIICQLYKCDFGFVFHLFPFRIIITVCRNGRVNMSNTRGYGRCTKTGRL